MKIEYNSRWIRFRLELFPAELELRRRRFEPPARALAVRRRLLRGLNQKFEQPPVSLEEL